MTYCLRDYEKALKECGLLLKSTVKDNLKVTGLTFDSREVATGTLFICKGAAFKREYLDMAEEKGAIACVSGTEYSDFPCITVSDIRRAMAVLANMYYDEPWKKLKLTGFGGTKGKIHLRLLYESHNRRLYEGNRRKRERHNILNRHV